LFQQSARRFAKTDFAAPVVLTNSDFRFIVTEQLQSVGVDPGAVLIEPAGRNTAPAVLAAALHLVAKDPQAIMLVSPSDHVIPDSQSFSLAALRGLDAVAKGDLVTFGIAPDRPETGYGYLELPEPCQTQDPVRLLSFVEKPDADRAKDMVSSGRHLWNAGIFMGRAQDFVTAFRDHAPQVFAAVSDAVETATPDLGFLRLNPKSWAKAPDISVDYAVMEKATNMVTRGLNQEGTCIYTYIYTYIHTYIFILYIYVALDFTSDDLINFIMLI
jgi:mannose-1-phosphate guanylyltransferase/mannose-6-phosphate isomerase